MSSQFLDFQGLENLASIIKSKLTGKSNVGHTHDYSDILNIPNTEFLLITEDMVTVATDSTKGVAPFSTSYGYTNITVNDIAESKLKEGLVILPIVNTKMVVASANRNVRIRFGETGTWHPIMGAGSSILAGSSYFAKSEIRAYVYSSKYQSGGAFHMFGDSNSTYSNASLGQGYGTCDTAETTAAKVVTLASYSLSTGGFVSVKFASAVPANATLNINSKGEKPVFYKGAAITADVIKAGDVATFVYDGTNYNLVATDRNVKIADWALASSKPTYTASEVGAATSGHNHSGVYQAAGTYVTASRTTAVEDTLTNSNAKVANSAAIKTFVEGKGYLVASDISGKADLSGATFTGNVTIGGTTINATNGHIVTATGLEIY